MKNKSQLDSIMDSIRNITDGININVSASACGKEQKTIRFKHSIILSENAHVAGDIMGTNSEKTLGHALVFNKGKDNSLGEIHLLCNTKAEPKYVGDQGIDEGEINCAKCIAKIKGLQSANKKS